MSVVCLIRICDIFLLKIRIEDKVNLGQGTFTKTSLTLTGYQKELLVKFSYPGYTFIMAIFSLHEVINTQIGKADKTFDKLRKKRWYNRRLTLMRKAFDGSEIRKTYSRHEEKTSAHNPK